MPESPPPADRALQALADAMGDSRPRRPGDGTDPDVPVAATVVVVRDGPSGPEVLMIERPDRGSFAGAWVFPGGKLEPDDALPVERDPGGERGPGGERRPGGESEPRGKPPRVDTLLVDSALREERVARRAGVRETWEETGLVVAEDSLVTLSCWDPPPGIAVRIRTWFFAAPAPAGELVLSPDEAVAAAWVRPAEVIERHGRNELTLYPPTWITLHGLRDQPSADALLAAVRIAGVHRFETIARRAPGGPVFLWQEDAEYDTDAAAPAPVRHGSGADAASARHRLEAGALPWIYTRTS